MVQCQGESGCSGWSCSANAHEMAAVTKDDEHYSHLMDKMFVCTFVSEYFKSYVCVNKSYCIDIYLRIFPNPALHSSHIRLSSALKTHIFMRYLTKGPTVMMSSIWMSLVIRKNTDMAQYSALCSKISMPKYQHLTQLYSYTVIQINT